MSTNERLINVRFCSRRTSATFLLTTGRVDVRPAGPCDVIGLRSIYDQLNDTSLNQRFETVIGGEVAWRSWSR
jgi:hypothetical protein